MEECARMNCSSLAVALLTFSPPEAKAWLYDLEAPDPTGGIMLCRKHANATVVPMSWQLTDARDPSWNGPVVAEEPVSDLALVAELIEPVLPSDSEAIDAEFAALQGQLPVEPQPYREPQLATARAAGNEVNSDLFTQPRADLQPVAADAELFELPLADIPAVTPYTR